MVKEVAKSEHMTFVHSLVGLRSHVILSVAKNLSERPFVALRVTTLVCQSFVVRFSQRTAGKTNDIPIVTCSARIESEEIWWRTEQERREERKRIHSWAWGYLMRVLQSFE
jgi:hypothetical protein